MLQPFLIGALVVTAVAAVIDWRTGEIPNPLSLGPLLLAPLAHAVLGATHEGWSGAGWALGMSILGAVACSIVPALLYALGGMFGGDVKLLAAVGAMLTPMLGLEAEFYAFLGAALVAPAQLAYRGTLLKTLGNTLALAMNPFLPKSRRRTISPEMMSTVRFGPAIFFGTCVAAFLNWGPG